ncbi:DUF6725 family protein [Bombiscardovia coagulans]|uniref:Uncharacterized protein n=1 Tax=Bombiscardovia coagulans TaxID=686666 RepID=A0A261EP24_9BIFI|nr:DUF6725 family protein [Bombiscardovia coagulans]OZG48615.1 hypothetical protein BOCO_1311 [Bombiscardovia coagulans]
MQLPLHIPVGARIVVRTLAGVDETDHRMKYNDYIGHVHSWNRHVLVLNRDPAANGSRPAETVTIDAKNIVKLKPVPERTFPKSYQPDTSKN